MIIRYDFYMDGIDQNLSNICPIKKVEEEKREKYEKECKEWIICKDYSSHNKDYRKVLLSDNTLIKKYSCRLSKKLLIFNSKEEGKEYFDRILIKDIIDEDKEEGTFSVIPLIDYTPTFVGSFSCQHCKYCYGRSKIFTELTLIGIKDKLIKRTDDYIKCSALYNNPNWSKKINIKRYFYQLWVNKLEQKFISITKKLGFKKIYNYLNYR